CWLPLDVRVSRTADFACSRSSKARTRFGDFFFFRDFVIGDALLSRRLDRAGKIIPAALGRIYRFLKLPTRADRFGHAFERVVLGVRCEGLATTLGEEPPA